MAETTTELDVFANVEELTSAKASPFIPYDGDRLPLLKELTARYNRVEHALNQLPSARTQLGHYKGQLLDEPFNRKYPEPKPASDAGKRTQRDEDFTKAYFRRFPYQHARLTFQLAISNLAEAALALQECMERNISELRKLGDQFEIDLTMLDVQIAARLLFEAKQEHQRAAEHLAAQPNPPCNLTFVPFADALRRLTNDTKDEYWKNVRNTSEPRRA